MQINKTKIGIIGMGVLFSTTAAAQTLTLEPQFIVTDTNTTFSIQVQVSGDNIAGIQYDLNYNSTLIEAVNVSEGNFLKTDNSGVLNIPTKIDNNAGVVKFAGARIEKTGISGSGNAGNITFKTKAPGIINLTFNNVKVLDPELKPINVTATNGLITVKDTKEKTNTSNNQQNLDNSKNINYNNYFLIAAVILIILLATTYFKLIKRNE